MMQFSAMVFAGLLSQGSWGKIGSGDFVMPGVDLSARPGIEISVVSMKKLVWTGLVGAALWDLHDEAAFGVLGAEMGFTFFGAEGGVAFGNDEIGVRGRALLSGGPVTIYGEYLSISDCPWGFGVLVKGPIVL